MNPTTGDRSPSSSRVLTVPNGISAARIALIPVFVWLVLDHDTTTAGVVLFAIVVATDWVDGMIARRTGQVSDVGTILVRDLAVLLVAAVVLVRRDVRVEVRWIGKLATFSLMAAIPMVSWGSLGLPLAAGATVGGWAAYAVGIGEYNIAAFAYRGDIRRASYRGPESAGVDRAR